MSRRNPMSDSIDAPIKLFGRNIQLPDSNSPPPAAADDSPDPGASSFTDPMDGCAQTRKKEAANRVAGKSHKEDDISFEEFQAHEDMKNTDVKAQDRRVAECNSSSEEKVFKKPDKVLPCPRCNSMETKFCYFNNYNVNQPRHFCKSCQRYWTAGGTIRNVPVGAGRRKNKQISSQFQPLVISSNGGPMTHVNLLNSADPRSVSPTGLASPTGFVMETEEVCQNGNDPSLCRSVATSLTLQDKNKAIDNSGTACIEGMALPPSSGTSALSAGIATENVHPKEVVQIGRFGSSASHITPLPTMQGYPGPPAYPWNIGWTGMAYSTDNGHAVLVPWGFPPMATVPRFSGPTPSIIPLVPSPYWNWDASGWNLPSSSNLSPASSAGNSGCSGNTSPLGKHLRDFNPQVEEATEKCLWAPKTLRIDDPDEAAKSSIWTTLGIKPDNKEPFSKSGTPKEFLKKSESGAQGSEGDQTLQANPAALSRFQAFQEST